MTLGVGDQRSPAALGEEKGNRIGPQLSGMKAAAGIER